MSEHTSRILQLCISAGFLVFTLIDWSYNRIGQNIINLTATSLFTLGLDRIVIVYQWYQGSSAFEYQATFVVFCLLVLGRLFEKYNPSETAYTHFNLVCGVTLLFYLLLNTLFLLACTVILMLYTCRQIYRLMTDALLSSTQSIQRNELDLVLSLQKPYAQISAQSVPTNTTCSICLFEFQPDHACILLPVCLHCFHVECIEQWLQSKATCPYCRNNIRLSLV